MKKEHWLLIGVGLLSGVASICAVMSTDSSSDLRLYTVNYLTGIPYGLVTGIYFIRTPALPHRVARYTAWVIASGLSYAVAVWTTLNMDSYWLFNGNPTPLYFAGGGLIGALVLTIAFHCIFRKLSLARHLMVLVTGAVVAYAVMMTDPRGQYSYTTYVLYLVWQTVITALLGWRRVPRP